MKKLLFVLFTFLSTVAFAQTDVEMADTMRSNGKIFVVVGVISIILLGILIFLMIIDKRVRTLEKGKENPKS